MNRKLLPLFVYVDNERKCTHQADALNKVECS